MRAIAFVVFAALGAALPSPPVYASNTPLITAGWLHRINFGVDDGYGQFLTSPVVISQESALASALGGTAKSEVLAGFRKQGAKSCASVTASSTTRVNAESFTNVKDFIWVSGARPGSAVEISGWMHFHADISTTNPVLTNSGADYGFYVGLAGWDWGDGPTLVPTGDYPYEPLGFPIYTEYWCTWCTHDPLHNPVPPSGGSYRRGAPYTFRTFVGARLIVWRTLRAFANMYPGEALGALTYSGCSDALHTGTITMRPMTPGVRLVADSGVSYLPPQQADFDGDSRPDITNTGPNLDPPLRGLTANHGPLGPSHGRM